VDRHRGEWADSPTNRLPTPTREIALPLDLPALVTLIGAEAGSVYPLIDELITIGRSPEAALQLTTADVSRQHAQIYREQTGYGIEDLGSRNGTLVNGTLIKTHRLRFGDKIQIGTSHVFGFSRHSPVTEQLLEQQKLRAVGRLAGGVAHQFNNMLGVVRNSVLFLKEEAQHGRVSPSALRDCLLDIERAVARASDLTRQLVEFSQRGKVDKREVDLSAALVDLVRVVSQTAKAVRIEPRIDPQLVVLADHLQLRQALLNLCLFITDRLGDKGCLRLTARRVHLGPSARTPFLADGPHVELTLEDNGLGLDGETTSQLFEPFFSAGDGSMGLATVYGVIKGHGGHIEVQSELHVGTTFRLLLPVALISEEVDEKTATSSATPAVGRVILVVDDEPLVRRSTQRLLERLGHEVICAESGEEALALFAEHHQRIDLVLLDLVMPGLNGRQTLQQLRRHDPQVRALLTSGYGNEKETRAAIEAGALGLLRKPYGEKELKQAIIRALSAKDD
jgi:signal transduction histidine kinase/ActR/RegA family two-component response regulator